MSEQPTNPLSKGALINERKGVRKKYKAKGVGVVLRKKPIEQFSFDTLFLPFIKLP